MDGNPEHRLESALSSMGLLAGKTILVAVSGGADSVALLVMLQQFRGSYGYSLCAVTVNHRIRSETESGGDAAFVRSLCENLEPPVSCTVVDLAPGEVATLASKRGRGVEEAARHLRYAALERVAGGCGPDGRSADFIMTAHNRNDRNETMLMRFFQGSGARSLAGISFRRGRYVRPLLGCTHAELKVYLETHGICWREDRTNADDRYLRNRIRLHVVPVLDRFFPGWDTGVCAGAEKALLDEDLARSLVTTVWANVSGGIRCSSDDYFGMHPAVRLRFLRDGLELLASGPDGFSLPGRVSGGYLLELAGVSRNPDENLLQKCSPNRKYSACGLTFRLDGDSIFWGTDIVQNSKSGYVVYICLAGTYRLPFGDITVTGSEHQAFLDDRLGPFTLPLVVRSRTGGDTVKTADGRQKTLKKLLNDWSVPENARNLVPLVEQDGEVRAVYGSLLGYPDWYVQR